MTTINPKLPYWHHQLALSWYHHQPESHQQSFTNLLDIERQGPIDRTPETPGSGKNDEDIQIIILLDSIGTKIRIKVTQMHRSDRTISERLSLGRGLPLFGKLESRTVSFEERRVSEVSLRRDDYLLVVEETSYVSCDRMYVNSV